MNKSVRTDRNKFRNRASLTSPNNKNLSFKERLAAADKKVGKGIDLDAPIDKSGYMPLV